MGACGSVGGQCWNWFDPHWNEELWALLTIDPRIPKVKGIPLADETLVHLVCYLITIVFVTIGTLHFTLEDPASVTTLAFVDLNRCRSGIAWVDLFKH
jgi:hypothetical protein